jgi:hypothetical protein
MSDLVLPGQYKLLSAKLVTHSGIEQEFSGFIPVFSIEESIDSDCIRGTAEVIESMGYLETLPIRGEEDLIFQIEDALGQKNTYVMKIYKVSDVKISDTNDVLSYMLHFVSRSRYEASFRRIIEPFDDEISNIAKEVFEKYYPSDAPPLEIEPTNVIFRCIIPNYTPMQAMNFLANRAYSDKRTSCSFRFFENTNGYFFVTDEYLIEKALDDPENIKEFSFSDAINKSGDEFVSQMQNLIEIRNTDRVNTMSDLISGAYRSHVIEIDLVAGSVNLPGKTSKHSYNYKEKQPSYKTTSGGAGTEDVHSSSFIDQYFNQENERRYIVVKDYANDSGQNQIRGNQYLPEIVANRIAYRHHLNNTVLHAKTNGRLDLNAGDIINVSIPEFNFSSSKGFNPQLSGYYMVSSVTQSFVRDVHQTILKILKYDWSTQE